MAVPELPDVTVYVESLQARIVGRPLERVRIASPFLLRSVEPPVAAVEGKPVRAVERLGKRIVLGTDGELFLVLHLMIAGRLRWRDRGVYGGTNINGDIGFGMGRGDYFFPPNSGASSLWISDERGPSDFIEGLGMLGGTNHRHLNVYFQLQDVEAEPPSPPPEPPAPEEKENWDKLFERIDRIIDLLEEMSS